MWEEFKRQVYLGRKYILISFASLMGVPFLCGGMIALYTLLFRSDNLVERGDLLYMLSWTATVLFCVITWSSEKIANPFIQAIRMSGTRKQYVVCYMVLGILTIFLMLQTGNLHLLLLSKLSLLPTELAFFGVFNCLFLAAIVMVTGLWFSTMYLKYGIKSVFIVLGLVSIVGFGGTAEILQKNKFGQGTLLSRFMSWIVLDTPTGSSEWGRESLAKKLFELLVQEEVNGQLHMTRIMIIVSVLLVIFVIHSWIHLRRYTETD